MKDKIIDILKHENKALSIYEINDLFVLNIIRVNKRVRRTN